MAVSWVWAQMVRESKEGLDPHLLPFRIVVADVRIGSCADPRIERPARLLRVPTATSDKLGTGQIAVVTPTEIG